MKKIYIIESCSECPNFDYEYYSYEGTCVLLDDLKVDDLCDTVNEIYKECPLDDDTSPIKLEVVDDIELTPEQQNEYDRLMKILDYKFVTGD
jgi:hypothetical protein